MAVVAVLIERFIEDRESTGIAPLADYQALHPGYEDLVARVYAEASGEQVVEHPLSSPVLAPRTPPAVLGRYRLIQELGRGGQAIVWLAEDASLGRKVALKVLAFGAGLSGSALRRFRREAEIASRLDHPGICPVFDTGTEGGVTWIAMRHVEGETLSSRIKESRRTGGRQPVIPATREEDSEAQAHSGSAAAHNRAVLVADLGEKIARIL
jgi:hypothetical protein